jgi:hypothetical protein
MPPEMADVSARALAALGRINPAARMPDVARINQRLIVTVCREAVATARVGRMEP